MFTYQEVAKCSYFQSLDNIPENLLAALLTLLGTLLLQRLNKPKLVYLNPNSVTWSVAVDPDKPPVVLATEFATVQNSGWESLQNIEITFESEPDHFQVFPTRNYTTNTNPNGHFTYRIGSLGAKE